MRPAAAALRTIKQPRCTMAAHVVKLRTCPSSPRTANDRFAQEIEGVVVARLRHIVDVADELPARAKDGSFLQLEEIGVGIDPRRQPYCVVIRIVCGTRYGLSGLNGYIHKVASSSQSASNETRSTAGRCGSVLPRIRSGQLRPPQCRPLQEDSSDQYTPVLACALSGRPCTGFFSATVRRGQNEGLQREKSHFHSGPDRRRPRLGSERSARRESATSRCSTRRATSISSATTTTTRPWRCWCRQRQQGDGEGDRRVQGRAGQISGQGQVLHDQSARRGVARSRAETGRAIRRRHPRAHGRRAARRRSAGRQQDRRSLPAASRHDGSPRIAARPASTSTVRSTTCSPARAVKKTQGARARSDSDLRGAARRTQRRPCRIRRTSRRSSPRTARAVTAKAASRRSR